MQDRPGPSRQRLKVDCFLNHQLDVDLLDKVGEEFYRIFKNDGINKILTIEASGIAIACMTARYFNVPVVFAKKAKSKNIDGEVYTSTVHPLPMAAIMISPWPKSFLSRRQCADSGRLFRKRQGHEGSAGCLRQAGCSVGGIGICIEKGFQPGGAELRRCWLQAGQPCHRHTNDR